MTSTSHEPCTIILGRKFAEEALLRRIRGEFREMPGMRLTVDQAMRLFMLDRHTCTHALDSLVSAHFLQHNGDGLYQKLHGGY